jgi:hypothetical protein
LETKTWAGAYLQGAGDAHTYPEEPRSTRTDEGIRNLGKNMKPVYLSEFGIGSLFNTIDELHHFEEVNADINLSDVKLIRSMKEKFLIDWNRWGFDSVYPFPEDMFRASYTLHAQHRAIGFDLIRSNPKIVGYNLTGMLDHAITGEGVWTFWRKFKPGVVDVMADGWAPLRWCCFITPMHGFLGKPFHLEIVLANEDFLKPGDYPVSICIFGPKGRVWDKNISIHIPDPVSHPESSFAVPVFSEDITLNTFPGEYELAVSMDQGGVPAGGRLRFWLSSELSSIKIQNPITILEVGKTTEQWFSNHGLKCNRSF